ncbi:PKD domain-containing protein [Deinococcus sonorensis]|uniref:PKD domain-containing protein n=1 Tax=Deinococcus sonorensis TaxID=309891 RepID=A0ABV8YAP4_9DEIO
MTQRPPPHCGFPTRLLRTFLLIFSVVLTLLQGRASASNEHAVIPPFSCYATFSCKVNIDAIPIDTTWETVDWGDGTTTAARQGNASHTYAAGAVGPHIVRVLSTAADEATGTITVLDPGDLKLTLNPGTVKAGDLLQLTLTGLADQPTYTVDWGDAQQAVPRGAGGTVILTHRYTTPQDYIVTVKPNAGATAGPSASASVTVEPLPVDFTVVPTGPLKATVTFTNLVVTDTAPYRLDWGDNSPVGTLKDASPIPHTYSLPGTYHVTLAGGGMNIFLTRDVTVQAPPVTLTISPPQGQPGTVFAPTATGLLPDVTYTLDWGDGSKDAGSSTLPFPPHQYKSGGTFTVQLLNGNVTVSSAVVQVTVPAPTATASVVDLTARLSLSKLLKGITYTVSWGDGGPPQTLVATGDTVTPEHTYTDVGTYVIIVTPDHGTPAAPVKVTTFARTPTVTVAPAITVTGQLVKTTVKGLLSSLRYRLDWGDGRQEELQGVTNVDVDRTHSYARPGNYTVTVTPLADVSHLGSVNVTVNAAAPVLSASVNRLRATVTASGLIPDVTYTLLWGNGASSSVTASGSTATLTYDYPRPNTYHLTMQANLPAAQVGQTDLTVPVPTPTFMVPGPATANTPVVATAEDLVPGVTYILAWGDNSPSTSISGVEKASPTHTYTSVGTFQVQLSVNGAVLLTQAVTVNAPAPVLTAGHQNLTATLNLGQLVRMVRYSVNWADGVTESLIADAEQMSLKHTYQQPGTYHVVVSTGAVQSAVDVTVRIDSAPAPGLTLQPDVAAVYQPVTANVTQLQASLTYTLDWADGSTETLTGVTAATRVHSYAQARAYAVQVSAPETGVTTHTVTVQVPVPTVTVQATGLGATAVLANLVPQLTYQLDWGDHTAPEAVTGAAGRTLTHRYATPGTYTVQLRAPGVTDVTAPVSVTVPPANVDVTAQGLAVTAQLTALEPSLTYTLDWGDQHTTPVTGAAAQTLTHAYALPGTYTVRLTSPGVVPVVRPVVVQADPARLIVLSPDLTATATLSGLLPAAVYTIDWGDGQQQQLSGAAERTVTHRYAATGQYTVTLTTPGQPPVTTSVVVGLPPTEQLVATPGSEPATVTVTAQQLLASSSYLLDYGDGVQEPLAFEGTAGRWTHRYTTPGTHVITLSLRLPDGTSAVRAVATVQVQVGLAVTDSALSFTRPEQTTTLTLDTLDPFAADLTVQYTGSGTLSGEWLLDGQPVQAATLQLPEGSGTARVTLQRSEQRPGRHTLAFHITQLTSSCPACGQPFAQDPDRVTLTLDTPTTLTFGDFKVQLDSIGTLDPQAFAATGSFPLIVGGGLIGTQRVTVSGLQVQRSGAVVAVTGGAPLVVNLNGAAVRSVRLGFASVTLDHLTLSRDGAQLSGTLHLPDTTTDLAFQDAPLSAAGDLLAEARPGGAALTGVKIGSTGITVAGSSALLDLSARRNPDGLAEAYRDASAGAPGSDWMGVLLPAAQVTVAGDLFPGAPVTLQAPMAYTLGGYTASLTLPGGTRTVLGWPVTVRDLRVGVQSSSLQRIVGPGSVQVPLVNEPLPVTLGWNPNIAGTGSKWTLRSDAPLPSHSFGRTSLQAGAAAWDIDAYGAARLKFSNASWNLGGVSGANVVLPLYNLMFTADGNATLGGKAWASITGLTNLSLFKYPFPAAELGVQRQANGQYTLGLRGKLQVASELPVSAQLNPVLFWIKDGQDVRVTIDRIHLSADIRKVSVDLNVDAEFKDADTLEFNGDGTLTIAEKLKVAAKAGFGREDGTSYGYVWASVAAQGSPLRPLAQIDGVGFYEFHGGLALNMVWPEGRFDRRPVKAIPTGGDAVTVALQGGTVFGTVADEGRTAHFSGTLGFDTEGSIAITAKAWLFKPISEGALGGAPENGQALVNLVVPPSDPASGHLLVQACVGRQPALPAGGLDCSKTADVTLYDMLKVRGFLELYAPFSGNDFHLYVGTRQNPVRVQLLTYPEQNGYVMIDRSSLRAGAGLAWSFTKEQRQNLVICTAYYKVTAGAHLNADFGVTYTPPALDASVSFGASASAEAGCGDLQVRVAAGLDASGTLHVAQASKYFDGDVSAYITLPSLPDISFQLHTHQDF